jgi:hypothetical protein
MAVTYTSITWGKIEQPLVDILSVDFPNVYASPRYIKAGNESVRINVESHIDLMTTQAFEQREYSVLVRYYFENSDPSNMNQNEALKNKIDRIKKKMLDSIVETSSSKHAGIWDELIVDSVEYDIQDDENDEDPNLYIAELMITIQHTYNH